jgi:tetratricopeptide (TPR) repeat protein
MLLRCLKREVDLMQQGGLGMLDGGLRTRARVGVCCALAIWLMGDARPQSAGPGGAAQGAPSSGAAATLVQSQLEFQAGADLTRQGRLQDAIPHLLAAQKAGSDSYATNVNLGICYVGLGRYKEAIAALESLRTSGYRTGVVENLLTQAYLGDGQMKAAMETFQQAASLTPKDEKLYAFVADACTDHQAYDLGLHVTDVGLQQLPDSARLHYERALFLARLDRLEEAKPEFDRAAQLGPGSYVADLALVQKRLYDDDYKGAILLLHEVVKDGHRDPQTLSLLGTVLMQAGAAPGEPEFAEAKAVLEESAGGRPDYSATQIALGKIYSMEGRFAEAAEHLETGRRLEPGNRSVYAALAHVYRKMGDLDRARLMEAQLAQMLAEQKANPLNPHQ